MSMFVFAFLVVGLVILFGSITRPYWGGFVRVPAVVTSQHAYFSRGDHCDLGLQFTMDGHQHTATFDPASTCGGMPKPWTTVTASVDPADPSHVLIVGLDQFQRNRPFIFAFAGAIWLGIAGAFLGNSLSTYRHVRALACSQKWKQLGATVLRRTVYKNTTNLTIGAPGAEGVQQIFQLTYTGSGPWSGRPAVGQVVQLRILANGGQHVLLSGPDSKNAAAGRVFVPNSFELRTLGL
ncbi:hypothetical protein [Arthrobacter sp. efr-133-TYG-120]|uniref:hypothetical protein n=1 Tax=Arthrobacter sp. efr-133-TYG-120 TaxID=3040280 RepID=UPI00254EAC5E|nr:hypothetical protein [Arthrobacter sp. efr-133-TYG-120]